MAVAARAKVAKGCTGEVLRCYGCWEGSGKKLDFPILVFRKQTISHLPLMSAQVGLLRNLLWVPGIINGFGRTPG